MIRYMAAFKNNVINKNILAPASVVTLTLKVSIVPEILGHSPNALRLNK